eukprot:m.172538 g.172538  ORF g.172538 m.172538 type:complete len:700 (-) comp13555_c0_seq1:209-2308(-)
MADLQDDDESLAKEIYVKDSDLIKRGFLTKLGGIRKNWKKRFFKLSVVQMAYYTTDGKKKFKGAIPLSLVQEIRAANKAEMGGKAHGLIVETKGRTFKFVADSDALRDEWVLAVDAAVKTARLGSGGAKKAPPRPGAPELPARPEAPAAANAAAPSTDQSDGKVDEYGDGVSIYVNAADPDDGGSAPAAPVKNDVLIEGVIAAHRLSLQSGVKSSFFVRATFDYEALDAEEISFKKNDILQVLDASHDDWWLVRTATAEGHVPSNRVAPIKVDSGEADVYEAVVAQRTGLGVCTVAHTAASDDELTLAVGDEVQLIEKVGDDKFKGRVPGTSSLPKLFPASCVEVKEAIPTGEKYVDIQQVRREAAAAPAVSVGSIAVCVQDFEAEEADELGMKEGDRVVITGVIDADWCRGRLEKDGEDGKVGMFAMSFVKVEAPAAVAAAAPTPAAAADATPATADAAAPDATAAPSDGPRMVKCVQIFEAEHEDELNLKVGDIVEVLEEIDADWLKGKVHGQPDAKIGIFPIAFVKPADPPAASEGADAPAAEEPAQEEAAPAPAGGEDSSAPAEATEEAKADEPAAGAPEDEAKEESKEEPAPAAEEAAPAEEPKEEAKEEEAKEDDKPAEPEAAAAPAEDTPAAATDGDAKPAEDDGDKKAEEKPAEAAAAEPKKAPPPVAKKKKPPVVAPKKKPPVVAPKKSA